MYIQDGIAYAGEQTPALKIVGVRPLPDYKLWVRFSTGECGTFDFRPLLSDPCFAPLKTAEVFQGVYLDYGVPVWLNGDVDLAPEYLYAHSRKQ